MGIYQIAIDGPSGAGKSTIARMLAERLGIAYLDTGAMYRACALHMLDKNISLEDERRVAEELLNIDMGIIFENGAQKMFVSGKDVSERIREHHMSKAASDISKLPCVREKLVSLQRELAKKQSCVLDGRDICLHVLPDARYKFFLTASANERAKRRAAELAQKGKQVNFETVLADINDRDYNDMHRAASPLVQAPDAVLVDSTNMTLEQVLDYMLSFIEE
ncbi:MAG TPA: (d)CMP kinase [Firmicutes bacterium]|nr:(d)CMP kinase [Bacillota bacterium]